MTRLTIAIIFLSSFLFSCNKKLIHFDGNKVNGDLETIYLNQYEAEKIDGKWIICSKSYAGHQILIYDDNSNLVEVQHLNLDKSIKSKEVRKYNENNLVESVSYNQDGSVYRRKNFTPKKNEILEVEVYDGFGKVVEKLIYKKKKHLVISFEKYQNGTLVRKYVNNYEGEKPINSISYDKSGNILSRTVFESNENMDPTKTTLYYKDGKVYSKSEASYEYDHHKNWIKQIRILGNSASIWTKRIIYKDTPQLIDFEGVWIDPIKGIGIKINKDKSYNWGTEAQVNGCREGLKDHGIHEVDENGKKFIFKSKTLNRVLEYEYQFEEFFLILIPVRGGEILQLEKIL